MFLVSQISTSKEEPQIQIKTHQCTVSRVLDQYGSSNWCVAVKASAILRDLSIVTENRYSHITDRSKVHRKRKKTRDYEKKNTIWNLWKLG